jgi:hypothetical protein
VNRVRTRRPGNRKLIVESVSLGLGYAAALIWVGSAFVGSFGDFDDAYPYWPAIPHLRTDTAGALAFAVAIVTLVLSRYLQLRRGGRAPVQPVSRPAGVHALQSVTDTGLVLGTGLVLYLSVNAAMHPWTLPVQLSHLSPYPSEGTVRVIALAFCLVGAAVRRYLRASASEYDQEPASPQPAAFRPQPDAEAYDQWQEAGAQAQPAYRGPARLLGGDLGGPHGDLGGQRSDLGGQRGDLGGQRFGGQQDNRNGGPVKLGHQPPWGTDYQ